MNSRDLTEVEQKAVKAECDRHRSLRRGWHAIKEHYLGESATGRVVLRWRWFVVSFEQKGRWHHQNAFVVPSRARNTAIDLAMRLQNRHAIPYEAQQL